MRDWSKMIERAERELAQSRAAIESGATKSHKPSQYRIGKGVSGYGESNPVSARPKPKQKHGRYWKVVKNKSDSTVCDVCNKRIPKQQDMHWLPQTRQKKHIGCSGRKLLQNLKSKD